MKELTLNKREEDYLKLNIGEESFLIPLASNMTLDEAHALDSMEGAISFFREHIRGEVADTLTMYNWKELISEWRAASQLAMDGSGELTPGES